MSGKTIELKFSNYKPIFNTADAIDSSGIYCIYAMTTDRNGVPTHGKLIYIGEGSKVKTRLESHNRLVNGKQVSLTTFLDKDQTLFYSVAAVTSGKDDRLRAEAALIFKIKPTANTSNTASFNEPETTIKVFGSHHQIPDSFTVN